MVEAEVGIEVEVGVEVGTEVGSGRYTGCSVRLKRGSGARSNTASGHLLVVAGQT